MMMFLMDSMMNFNNTKKKGVLVIEEISDVHLGHNKTTTEEVLQGLYKTFPNNATMDDVDIIFIAGDLFDRLLNLPDDNVVLIKKWINDFLRMCAKRNIVIRVLEGTPSHDWKQCKYFIHENENAHIHADLKYMTTLCIEYIEKFDCNVLYIPDEWKHSTDEIWMDVKQTLSEQCLEKVDFVVMHGAFSYQLPPNVPAPTHDPQRYLDITNHFVFVGHIHKHSIFERIISAGSHNRLCHNEEEPKGHVRVELNENGKYKITFKENVLAKIYKTINCSSLSVEEAFNKLSICNTLPNKSEIRILCKKTDAIFNSVNHLKEKYPHIVFSFKRDEEVKKGQQSFKDIYTPYTPPAITSANLKDLIVQRLLEEGKKQDVIKRAEEILNENVLSSTI